MLIGKDDLGEIFDRIHNVWIQTRTAVVILAAADCDSICTTKILTSVFRTENIAYQIHPVLSYEHIAKYNDSTLQQRIREGELHSVIMINCGGIVDLNQMLFIRPVLQKYYSEKQQSQQNRKRNRNRKPRAVHRGDDDLDELDDDEEEEDIDLDDEDETDALHEEEDQVQIDEYIEANLPAMDDNFKIYVIDSHRPFNLINVYDQDKIYLLQGEDEQKIETFPELIHSEDEEEEQEQDQEDKHKSTSPTGDDEDDDDDEDFDVDDHDDDDDDDDLKQLDEMNEPLRKKRKLNGHQSSSSSNGAASQRLSDNQRRLIRIQREQDEYYKYQYFGLHSSGIAYLMARHIQKDDNDTLWAAVLGLTESFIYEKIDRDQYNHCITCYCDEVKRRNETYHTVSTMDDEVRYNTNDENVESSTVVTHRQHDHIQFSSEFRFVLMRYWTLYDSMYYSRYIATKLGVWKQRGKENLKFLLAKMALPLNEAQQPYCSMKRMYKRKLPELFSSNLNQGLDNNLTFGSFTKQHGGHQSISASDMVYAIAAVLESDFKVKSADNKLQTNNDSKSEQGSSSEMKPNENGRNEEKADNEMNLFFDDDAWQSNFFYAYDVLSKDKQYLLRDAIELAKNRQRDIIDMGIKLIEKRDITTIGIMRWCKIENSNKFQSPMLLCKLALFIMDAYRAQTTKNAKHFVLASYNDKCNSYTVVGVPAKRYIGDVNKSPFYNAFEEARKRVNATAKIVFFEGHVIQIHKDHFTEWLENLHERLLSYAF